MSVVHLQVYLQSVVRLSADYRWILRIKYRWILWPNHKFSSEFHSPLNLIDFKSKFSLHLPFTSLPFLSNPIRLKTKEPMTFWTCQIISHRWGQTNKFAFCRITINVQVICYYQTHYGQQNMIRCKRFKINDGLLRLWSMPVGYSLCYSLHSKVLFALVHLIFFIFVCIQQARPLLVGSSWI